MNLFKLFIPLTAILLILSSCEKERVEKTDFKSIQDSMSYVTGIELGNQYRSYGRDVNPDFVKQGLIDAYADTNLFSRAEMMSVKSNYRKVHEANLKEIRKKKIAKNRKDGLEAFTDILKDKDVVIADSGLVYKIIQKGTGRSPGKDQEVLLQYAFKTIEGKMIFSNYANDAEKIKVSSNIPGIRFALKKMKKGSVWELYLPEELAFGDYGNPQYNIEPGQYLRIQLELIDIM